VILFGIIDFGATFGSYVELRSASRDGARLAVVDNGCFPGGPDVSDATKCGSGSAQLARLKADILAHATGIANTAGITVLVCYPANATVGTANVTVTLSYQSRSLTGYLGFILNNITLASTSVMRIEQAPTYSKDASCP
ncbi:MAG TPA: hypothetical protein VIV06_07950, partial [Candidatus Limnocylindrales bacterium]